MDVFVGVKPSPRRILIKKSDEDYYWEASIEGQPQAWANGKSIDEALGSLLNRFSDQFDFVLVNKEGLVIS